MTILFIVLQTASMLLINVLYDQLSQQLLGFLFCMRAITESSHELHFGHYSHFYILTFIH